jgi:predicted secreted Zn-dependent protease
MLDLEASGAYAIAPVAIIRHCEVVKRIARKHPRQANQLIQALQPDAPLSDIETAIDIAKKSDLQVKPP